MFESVNHAMVFMFNTIGREIVKLSSVYKMREPSGSGELSAHDQHAQAALIAAACERVLDVNERAFIVGSYGVLSADAENQLANMLLGVLGTGIYSKRGAKKLVINYFNRRGDGISMISMRKDFHGVSDRRMREIKRAAYEALDKLNRAANTKLDEEFYRCRLIDRGE
jgi:viroplasmin and RNaseH domain-containing protein